ncbi:MAG: tetratricopeptide repeat protein [Bacteroidales bacterium]|nr:tetratricopeptide repeat protein [Bacteroidales bacterium]
MNISEIHKKCATLHDAISDGMVSQTMATLKEIAAQAANHDLTERLDEVSFAYDNLINYYIDGVDDPEKENVRARIVGKLHDIIDDWGFATIARECTYSQQAVILNRYRQADIRSLTEEYTRLLAAEAPAADLLTARENIFNVVWACQPKHIDTDALAKFLNNSDIPSYDRELVVGAAVIALSLSYSEKYLELLLSLCDSAQPRIAARSVVGVMLALMVYARRLRGNRNISQRLEALTDNTQMRSTLFDVYVIIERTRVVDSIEQKMKDEITPEILKAHNINKIDVSNNVEIIAPNDLEELFSRSPKLKNSIEQLSKWQTEGADVFLPTFRHLKNFSFFYKLCNWLLPFYKEQPELNEALKNESDLLRNKLSKHIESSSAMCDSDKYSILLSFTCIPQESKDSMSNVYNQELEQHEELIREDLLCNERKKVSILANQFVQDLYRLFFVNPLRHELCNVFSHITGFYRTETFNLLFDSEIYTSQLADFYARHSLMADAQIMFEKLRAMHPENVDYMRKTAYCYLMAGDIDKALELLLIADIADDNDIWTKRKIALCLQKQGKYAKALTYFEQAEEIAPNNYTVKYAMCKCLIELRRYADALRHLFEIEYNQPNNSVVFRPIAWCSFAEGKLEQAENYLGKIDRKDFDTKDYMLEGHLRFCRGERRNAVEAYCYALARHESEADFTREFRTDATHLAAYGITEPDTAIMLDAVLRKSNI